MSNATGEQPQPDDQFDAGHFTEEPTEQPVGRPSGGFSRPADAFESPEKPKNRWTLIAAALVGALVVGGASGGIVSALNSSNDGSSSQSSSAATDSNGIRTVNEEVNSKLADTVAQAQKSVVTISVRTPEGDGGTGSGIVLNDGGYIATNAHVATLEGKSSSGQLAVQTSTGDVYKAKLVGYDSTADTAVIQISASAKGIEPITFANSDQVEVGDQTIAIGAPLGLSGTVTSGIVSAINRPISVASSDVQGSVQSQQGAVSLNAIQTDAAINSGNSGGALLNAAGDLIGMNDAIATSGDSTGSIGIGFSIPSNYVKRVAQEIIDTGRATHGKLGASVGDASATNSTTLGFGAQIQSVTSGGAAARAGLQAQDVIIKMANTVITDATQLTALVREQAPNSTVSITYTRGSTSKTTTVKLDAAA